MKTKLTICKILYYPIVLLLMFLTLYLTGLIIGATGYSNDLGVVILATIFMVYILLPILFLLFMRFSLLKWYVDPIAAFTAPLFIFLVTLSSNIEKGHDFLNAFSLSLSDFFTTTSLIYSIILFILGLLASFSFKRKEEKSLSYKIIYKIIK